MKLGTKEQVLLAIYVEYQKDIPHMESINNTALNMDIDVFNIALDKLQNEEYIKGFATFEADNNRFYTADTSRLKITKQGIDYIETAFGIHKEITSSDKVKYIVKQCGIFGYKAMKDFAAAALTNIANVL